jgi:hypothetical protein
MSLPDVTEIRRWALQPGDRLIVSTSREISQQDTARIKQLVIAALALPAGFPVLVTGPGVNVEVGTVAQPGNGA